MFKSSGPHFAEVCRHLHQLTEYTLKENCLEDSQVLGCIRLYVIYFTLALLFSPHITLQQ